MNHSIQISRRELYEEVWSEAMSKVAKRYGLSDVGLAKICRKHNIPVPHRGYWARKQAGQKPPRAKLPQAGDEVTITIHPSPPRDIGQARDRIAEEGKKIGKYLRKPAPDQEMHLLVQQSFKILSTCEPSHDGLLQPPNVQCLDIQVAPGSLERALKIMNSVIRALEGCGHSVSVKDSGTAAEVNRAVVQFSIIEETKRRFKEPKEHDLSGWYQFGHSQYSERRFPTGNLLLKIQPSAWLGNYRTHWRDTDSKKVEDILESFIKGILKIAALLEKERGGRAG